MLFQQREVESVFSVALTHSLPLYSLSAVLHYIISFINAIIMLQSQASVRAWQRVKEREREMSEREGERERNTLGAIKLKLLCLFFVCGCI